VLVKPIGKKLIWNAYLRCRLLNPLEVNRREPRVIDLLRDFALDVG